MELIAPSSLRDGALLRVSAVPVSVTAKMNAPSRPLLPDWPRLMSEGMAAAYLSIGTTTLREAGPTPKRKGRRCLYDRRDLDRWADRLDGQPLDVHEQLDEAKEVERRFLEGRNGTN